MVEISTAGVDAPMQTRSPSEGIITLRYLLRHPGAADRYAEFDRVVNPSVA